MSSPKKQFDAQSFLAKIGAGRTLVRVKKKQQVYAQGAKNAFFPKTTAARSKNDKPSPTL